ncbi:MAG: hypothetical protein WCE81_05135 [Halobacteriota archaeon]
MKQTRDRIHAHQCNDKRKSAGGMVRAALPFSDHPKPVRIRMRSYAGQAGHDR